jgi:hypothetical protein
MRIVASGFVGLAGVVFIAASAAMNWIFMRGQGKTAVEGEILGLVSIAVDVVKALLPFLMGAAWAHRQWLRAGLGFSLFALFFTFSLLSALGFVASNRGAVAGGRATAAMRFELARQALGETEARLATLGSARPDSQIAAEIAGLKQDRRWGAAKGCAMATAAASRAFCAEMFAREAELAKARAAGELRTRRDVLRAELTHSQAVGAGEDNDPQAGLLSRLSGLDLGQAQQALSAFMAILVEIGAAATLYLAAGPGTVGKRFTRPALAERKTEPDSPGAGRLDDEERFRLPASGRILLSG